VLDDFPDDLITPDETAADLRVKPATLATWRVDGRGPPYWKWGRTIFYSRSHNRAWKAAQRRDPVPRSPLPAA
jgi:hypothetical protein